MLTRQFLAAAALVLAPISLGFTIIATAQTADPVVRVFHPPAPLPSYDVATIKPFDPTPLPGGMRQLANTTIRDYIRFAYAPASGMLASTQVIGGPEWLDKDRYIIQAKPPGDLELAMQKMKNDDRLQLDHSMRQSLLADRFQLKVHFEVREMPVYALLPTKGGLKIKPVADVAPPDPDAPTSSPAAGKRPANSGSIQIMMGAGGIRMLRARAISMAQLAGMIGGLIEQTSPNVINMATGGRPVLDQTGFTGYFDIDGLKWSLTDAASDEPSDAPSLTTALDESLGIKLVATRGPVEVVVIDSIDHPSEN